MSANASVRPVVLIAALDEHPLTKVSGGTRYAVVQVHTGAKAVEQGHEVAPDLILLDAELPDMSGIDACRLLHSDPRFGHNVPILILASDKPTPEQRVAALHAGAWDFLRAPADPEELWLTLGTYVQAKQNIDVALAAGLVDPATGLHSRPALARRARELGALLARERGALACIVFALGSEAAIRKVASTLIHTARLSDVVGTMSPTEFAVLAPGTNHAGAVKLAERVGAVLSEVAADGAALTAGSTLRAGYDAVGNLAYAPVDPAELLARATAAVRGGQPDPASSWVRRYDAGPASGEVPGRTPRTTPAGIVLDNRRVNR